MKGDGKNPGDLTRDEADELSLRAGKVFAPSRPTANREFFIGRREQLQDVMDAIGEIGQHVVIYGERGVGKTSIGAIIEPLMHAIGEEDVMVTRVNASKDDTFGSLWEKALTAVTWPDDQPIMFHVERATRNLKQELEVPDEPNGQDILQVLSQFSNLVFVFDEFDLVKNQVSKHFAELIKLLSDFQVRSTVIIVGVATTVRHLLKGHISVRRSLVEVQTPRMERDELKKIIQIGSEKLDVEFSTDSTDWIISLSHGLPHYTHLLALNAIRNACIQRTRFVTYQHTNSGLKKSIRKSDGDITDRFLKAIHSTRSDATHFEVLTACALADTDDHGYFKPSAIASPLQCIKGLDKSVQQSTFTRQLNGFCTTQRGAMLEKVGVKNRPRYKFRDPMYAPYVIIHAIADEIITPETFDSNQG